MNSDKSKYARDINILNKLSIKQKERILNAIECDFLTVFEMIASDT